MAKISDNELKARKNLLRDSQEAKGESVRGYNFDDGIDWKKLVGSYRTTGFQATNLSKAMDIIKKMRKEKVFVYLGYTSNMVSSGLRDIFRFLAERKMVDVIITTAGGVEEDIIKCLGDFKLGEFEASGKDLRDKGINRIGNIFVPNSRYVKFEEFMQPLLEEVYEEQKKTGKIVSPSELVWKMGEKIGNKESIYYNCWKNGIRIYCPAIMDGALGDNIYFFQFKHPDFKIDIVEDVRWFNNTSVGLKKSGIIILGSGVIKHAILNANMLRNGADYAVYINNSQEFDGSDAGARPDEAVSWGKITKDGESVKVFGDATIIFPIIVAETFAKTTNS